MDHDHGTTPGSGMDHGGGGGGGMMMMMSMTFHFGVKETILFDWWKTETANELIIAVFLVGVVALVYEGIKFAREILLQSNSSPEYPPLRAGSSTALHSRRIERSCTEAVFTWSHVLQTFLHMVQYTLSYLLMLVFMTYNVWLCVAVIVGAAIGYYLFGWRSNTARGLGT